jgi:hypothetical protein
MCLIVLWDVRSSSELLFQDVRQIAQYRAICRSILCSRCLSRLLSLLQKLQQVRIQLIGVGFPTEV